MDLALLDSTLAAAGEPAYRARQVWAGAARGAPSYSALTDLPLALRTSRRYGSARLTLFELP